MPPFLRIGKHVVNLRQVCSVVRIANGRVDLYLNNRSRPAPDASPFATSPADGVIALSGALANRTWRYWCEVHAPSALQDSIGPQDEPLAAEAEGPAVGGKAGRVGAAAGVGAAADGRAAVTSGLI